MSFVPISESTRSFSFLTSICTHDLSKSCKTIFVIQFSAQALTCYCIGQYCSQHPSNSNSNNRDYDNSIRDDEFEEYSSVSLNDSFSQFPSCEAKKGAKCFSAVTQVEDAVTGELVPER